MTATNQPELAAGDQIAVFDPDRPDVVHLAVVGSGLACSKLRGVRIVGEEFTAPVSRTWCWEPVVDNPPTCLACRTARIHRDAQARDIAARHQSDVRRFTVLAAS